MRKKSVDPAREAWTLLIGLLHGQKAKLQAAAVDLQLTPAQAQLLARVDIDRPMTMTDLANQLFCDASNITGLVDKLESRDLIERQASTEDRRVKMIALTKAGAALRTKLLERFYEPPPPLTALPEADKKALRDILRRATK
ncbi:MAG: MarR family transcriptional regulator [Polyangiales bacterium]